MLVLNPEHLKATRDPLLPSAPHESHYAAIAKFALAALTTLAALFVGYSVTQYLGAAWPLWSLLAAVSSFVYLAALTAVIVDGLEWQVPLGVLWGAGFALALPWRGVEVFALAGIVAAASFFAYLAHRKAVRSYATLHTFTVLREYISVLATGIVIALIVLYGAAVNRGSALLPQGILARAADEAAAFVPALIPGVQPSASSTVSVRDLAYASAKAQLENDPRYQQLPPEQQAVVLKEAADQAAAAFGKQLGVNNAAPDASIGTVAQSAVGSILERFKDRYGWWFTIAWLLGAFFVARSAAFILTIAVAVIAWLTVNGAIAVGLLQVQALPSVREQIIL